MMVVSFWIGIICIVVSGIFLGGWTSGDQQRANFHSETSSHRRFRTNIAWWSGLFGIMFLAISVFLYFRI
ncbi:DUF5316 family protein [Bacillus sp. EB600]|uniref:DUF5316 family protein n=1 Tax=Bacillus sp. EB600 TaxID=2806345 RepID=UPI00210A1942|nr:DUF5316 family protein [Bacillus sp. EB600]MCQ6281994.1 hypothetical protein [Bacillus sp. EB600]